MLGCALVILTFQGRSAKAILPATPTIETVSPSPVPTPSAQKQPNTVRRFFSWVGNAVTRPFRKRLPPISDPPVIQLKSSSSLVAVCPTGQHSSDVCSTASEVELSATAGSPEVDADLLFTWNVTGGRIRGEGKKVMWDLAGVAEGTYTATVEVNGGNQLTATDATKVTVTRCSDCVWMESPCPTISVSCPSAVDLNQPIIFEASVAGGYYEGKLTYTWSVTSGEIVRGQGTSKITVNALSAGQTVTATMTLGGIDPRCKSAGIDSALCRVDEVRRP